MSSDVREDVAQRLTKLLDRLHLWCKRLSDGIAGSTKGLADRRNRILHSLGGLSPGFGQSRRGIVPELLKTLTRAFDGTSEMLTDSLADRENGIRETLDLLRPLRSDCVSELCHCLEERRTESAKDVLNLLEWTAGSRRKTEDRSEDIRDGVTERLEDVVSGRLDCVNEFAKRL